MSIAHFKNCFIDLPCCGVLFMQQFCFLRCFIYLFLHEVVTLDTLMRKNNKAQCNGILLQGVATFLERASPIHYVIC